MRVRTLRMCLPAPRFRIASPSIAATQCELTSNTGRGTNPTRAGRKSSHGGKKTIPQTTASDTQTTHTDQAKDSLELVLCGNSQEIQAEDKGFEPSTGFPAPDFESGS